MAIGTAMKGVPECFKNDSFFRYMETNYDDYYNTLAYICGYRRGWEKGVYDYEYNLQSNPYGLCLFESATAAIGFVDGYWDGYYTSD